MNSLLLRHDTRQLREREIGMKVIDRGGHVSKAYTMKYRLKVNVSTLEIVHQYFFS